MANTYKKSHPNRVAKMKSSKELCIKRKIYLALSYFRGGPPPNYLRRCSVSPPSSRWIGVVPLRHEHQDIFLKAEP